MKRIIVFFVFLICFVFGINSANAYEGILDGYQVVYNPTTKVFSTGGMAPSRIIMTKKTSAGSGGYSEYYLPNGRLEFTTGGNFEFIDNGKLISVHNADLKFYRIVYEDGKYIETLLKDSDLKKIFPDAEIIKISQFKDNSITINKKIFTKKKVLLINDTNGYFYKYSYKPKKIADSYITSLLTLKMPGKITFAHYKDNSKDNPKYTIFVKNILK